MHDDIRCSHFGETPKKRLAGAEHEQGVDGRSQIEGGVHHSRIVEDCPEAGADAACFWA